MKNFVDDVKKIGYHLLGNQAQAVVGELAEPVREQDGKKKRLHGFLGISLA